MSWFSPLVTIPMRPKSKSVRAQQILPISLNCVGRLCKALCRTHACRLGWRLLQARGNANWSTTCWLTGLNCALRAEEAIGQLDQRPSRERKADWGVRLSSYIVWPRCGCFRYRLAWRLLTTGVDPLECVASGSVFHLATSDSQYSSQLRCCF